MKMLVVTVAAFTWNLFRSSKSFVILSENYVVRIFLYFSEIFEFVILTQSQ